MRNRRFHAGLKKRAVCAGLFLGMLCGMFGCVKPGPVVQPGGTKTPMPSPTEAGSLLPTSTPGGTETPVPTVGPTKPIPEITATPTPTVTPIPEETASPVPTATITPEAEITATPVPKVTVTPEPEAKGTPEPQITVSPTPDPSGSPEPELTTTPEPELTVTPEPETTVTPEPELIVTPEPEITVIPEPELTATPEPEITAIPEVTSAPMPDYNALLQNGWQRTEDFFGCREIFFSGQFTETELIAEEGYYEYRYKMNGDTTTQLSIIGETALLQAFLDELAQKGAECVILQEEDSLYSYVYTEDGTVVKGTVYTCIAEETEHRMRVELHYPEGEEEKSEVCDFYLR